MKKGLIGLALLLLVLLSSCGVKIVFNEADLVADKERHNKRLTTAPETPVTLKIVDWSDSTKVRRDEFHTRFEKKYPNVTIEYTVLTEAQFKESIMSSVKSVHTPDIFPLPTGINLATAVTEDWFLPLADYLDEAFFASFEPNSLVAGSAIYDDQVYLLPESANIVNTLLFYNKNVLRRAGIKENELPKTYEELLTISKRISAAGKGAYYGMLFSGAQTNRLALEISTLSSLAGAQLGESAQLIVTDGVNQFADKHVAQALDLYSELAKSNAMHPEAVSLKAPEARAYFAQNQAAFLIQGAWCISTWRQEQPELDFGVIAPPTPTANRAGGIPYAAPKGWAGISANSQHPDIAALYLQELYSEEYQGSLVADGGFVSIVKGVNEQYMTEPVMQDYLALHEEIGILAPNPVEKQPATLGVYANMKSVTPDLGDITQGVLSGKPDYYNALKDYATNIQHALEASIERSDGVSMSDFEFGHWNN